MAEFITYNCNKCKKLTTICASNPRRYIEKLCDKCDFQPERSKREDHNNKCWACGNEIGIQQSCYGCGTLNIRET